MSAEDHLRVDGTAVPIRDADSVLVAMCRAGLQPPGCLCATGDCPNCLAVVDGVAHTRTCQTRAAAGMDVRPHGPSAHPAAPPSSDPPDQPRTVETVHCDVVVVGAGRAGTAAATERRADGAHVEVVDGPDGETAIGVYPGPHVVTRRPEGLRQLLAREVVVATGAAWTQPACPGNDLRGILTPAAAEVLRAAGIELGRTVLVGERPEELAWAPAVGGRLIRFEPTDEAAAVRRIGAVVTADADGTERRHPCDTVVVALGGQPRDALARMGNGLGATAVGGAARPGASQPAPTEGVVCRCSDVSVADLESVRARGFNEMELVKRATLAGTGTCQGAACLPHLQAWLAAGGPQPAGAAPQLPHVAGRFTARPVAGQVTMGEVATGWHPPPTRRTALHDVHVALGATMERAGGWWRPWTYGDPEREYWAVRRGVSLGDVSTLAKFEVSGPDATAFLDRVYPSPVSRLRPGRSKYVLLLDEAGHVFDDGMVCRRDEHRFALTVTSAGGGHAEMWLRDWAGAWGCDVRILDRTMARAAINVTGPGATSLLERAGLGEPLAFADHGPRQIAGVPCEVFRLSFTGEVSYELHHDADRAEELWTALMALGQPDGIHPHGLDVLTTLRLEKGHLIVGVDTELDSTPRRLRHGWAVRADDRDFLGRAGLDRVADVDLDRVLTGFTLDTEDPPAEGAIIWSQGGPVGHTTSLRWSPVLGRSVGLGWVRLPEAGRPPPDLRVEGHPLALTDPPFYDPEGARARA